MKKIIELELLLQLLRIRTTSTIRGRATLIFWIRDGSSFLLRVHTQLDESSQAEKQTDRQTDYPLSTILGDPGQHGWI